MTGARYFWLAIIGLWLGINGGMLLAGETGKLAGQVTDRESGDPLIEANIIIESRWVGAQEVKLETPMGTATDEEGYFFVLNLRPGLYTVRVVYVGYRDEVRQRVRVDVDKTTRLDFQLAPQAIELETTVVTAYAPLKVEKDLTATKQSYSVDDVESIAGVTDVTDIISLQADVVDENFRGGRAGEALYLIGGSSIVNPLNRKRAFKPITTGLQEVEVYTSGFSAEYGNAQSGVVNMVTREGGDRWQGRLEISSDLPYYKTWEGSVYSTDNLDFYNQLINTEEWLKENPVDPGKPLWDVSNGFASAYLPTPNVWPPKPLTREDSLKIARLGQILWLQAVRDVGLEYDKKVDNRVDFSTGGPIAKNMKLFFAGRQNFIQPIIPTPNPDIERQIIGNLVYQMNPSNRYKLSYIRDEQSLNEVGSNWLRYMFDRTLSISKFNNTSSQYGLDWNHVFTPYTFIDMKFKVLQLLEQERIELLDEGEYVETYSNATNWVDYTGPSEHRVGRPEDDWGDQRVTSYSTDISIGSQVNKFNLIKAGFQFTTHRLNVDQNVNVSTEGNFRKLEFVNRPYEGAGYIQDKMEFSGMIANVGLRFDFYDLKTQYYTNSFSPLQDPEAVADVGMETIIQPRVGVSFPVSENSVFHLNYGTFSQRPSFDQVYFNQVDVRSNIDILGNPQLKPEKTNAYDAGLVQGLMEGFRLDVSAYYKDVSNLIQDAFFEDRQQNLYQTFINREYADIKGFHVSLEKVDGFLKGYARYNYESATANRPADLDVPVKFSESLTGEEPTAQLPKPGDVYLDFDRTHKAVFNLRLNTHKQASFSLFGFHPLGNINFSTTLRILSGRPYTYDDTGQGLQFNRRTPTESDWKLRLQKGLRISGQQVNIYLEAFNLLNERVYQYSRTFDDERNTLRWNTDRENILTYDLRQPYVTSQEIYLLSNQPRHYRVGMLVKF